MKELTAQPYFGVMLTVAAYWLGMKIRFCFSVALAQAVPLYFIKVTLFAE